MLYYHYMKLFCDYLIILLYYHIIFFICCFLLRKNRRRPHRRLAQGCGITLRSLVVRSTARTQNSPKFRQVVDMFLKCLGSSGMCTRRSWEVLRDIFCQNVELFLDGPKSAWGGPGGS